MAARLAVLLAFTAAASAPAGAAAQSPACPCTVFGPTEAPAGDAVADRPVEVGMKFRTSEEGYVSALRFYKQPSNTGRHVGNLWSADGTLLATATYRDETASGWQQVRLANPLPVTANAVYVVSYHSAGGSYAFSPGYFRDGVDRPPLHAPASTAVSGGNGVYRYGQSAFPDSTFDATNYWVDVVFERTVPPDTRGPTVTRTDPATDAIDVARHATVSASFDEPLLPATVTTSTFTLRDPEGRGVPADVVYDAATWTARLRPSSPLDPGTRYTATVAGGPAGVRDANGNPLDADHRWRFTVVQPPLGQGPGGPILVVADPADPFSRYYAEILRAEGLNAFRVVDSPIVAAELAGTHVVILARAALTDAELAELTTWVRTGGNLVAMRPDRRLASLLGVTPEAGTLAEGYIGIDTRTAPGAGLEGRTLQFHGVADRYRTSGASTVATLYSDAATATRHPAVTLRDVDAAGGQAAMFAYDLARSVVLTRQGNPAWAGQERDGIPGVRALDMFYGAKAGDVRPDWVDPGRFDVPQADEQQRLLANLVTRMALDRVPLPRFWYLPRGEKAAVVLTGDDHATGMTVPYFDRLKRFDRPGCSVADWECVRASSYVYPHTPMTSSRAAAYEADGFEVALHVNTGCADFTETSLDDTFGAQLARFEAAYPDVARPVTNRTHCVIWSDWATHAKVERRHGIRFDTNYYFNGPLEWVASRGPGLLTGSGLPQRFADLDGTLLDVYQSSTQISDEVDAVLPTSRQLHVLLDNAIGPRAYYGVFNVLLHSDHGDHERLTDLVAGAVDRGVPVVTSAQMLEWLDGRNRSSFAGVAYADRELRFSVAAARGSRGLQGMIPLRSTSGTLVRLRRDGAAVPWSRRTVKGVDYAVFRASRGDYRAAYGTDTAAPELAEVTAVPDGKGRATIRWTTDEPSSSRVEYGRDALADAVEADAPVTEHEIEIDGLTPGTTYRYRPVSVDAAGNRATGATATFTTPPGELVDDRTADFAAGSAGDVHVGATLAGRDGELQLRPTVAEEFEGLALPAGWEATAWRAGGAVELARGALRADGARAATTSFVGAPATLEFTATFQPVNNQGVGFTRTFDGYPMAAFHTGLGGQPYHLYAATGTSSTNAQTTPLPAIDLSVPHRFRIEWSAGHVAYFVDGVRVAVHDVTVAGAMRPVVTDLGAHGANVQAHWVRQGPYAHAGTFTSRALDAGPHASGWERLTASSARPAGTDIAFETRSGGSPAPDASWSAWQAAGSDGQIASPPARFVQYRARLSGPGTATPTLDSVRIAYRSDGLPPVPPLVELLPKAPTTADTLTAATSGSSDPDGGSVEPQYRWERNGAPVEGATGPSLDLSRPGHGNRGDVISVEVAATDDEGVAGEPGRDAVVVSNSPPAIGAVGLRPASAGGDDVLSAHPVGFGDADGDPLTYAYRWLRNESAIAGATGPTLDLSRPGTGDPGDTITVGVTALDGHGGRSAEALASLRLGRTPRPPVAGFGFEEAAGTTVLNSGLGHDAIVAGASRVKRGRFGRALRFDGRGDVVSVADDAFLRAPTRLTVSAWVRPAGGRRRQTVVAKQAGKRLAYALYARTRKGPGFRAGRRGRTLLATRVRLRRRAWTHLAASHDGRRMRLYVNGRQVRSRRSAGALRGGAGPLLLGRGFAGLLDEVRVYDRRLSSRAIRADMRRPVVEGTRETARRKTARRRRG